MLANRSLLNYIQVSRYDLIGKDISSIFGSDIFEQLARHTIVVFDSELEGQSMNDYQISIQIVVEEGDRVSYIVQFVNVK